MEKDNTKVKKFLFFILIFIFSFTSNAKSQESKKELSLKDCVNLALINNLDIKVEEFNPVIAEKNIEIEKTYFDKNFIAELNKSYAKKPTSSTLQGATNSVTDGLSLSAGISQTLYSGTNYTLKFNTQSQDSNSKYSTLNPYYQSDITLSLTHPLKRGKGVDINKTKINIANIESEIAQLNLQQKIIEITNLTEVAYYNLQLYKEELAFKEKAMQSAQEFENIVKEKVKVGVLPKSDILQAQAKSASIEAELISAKADFQKALDNLLILINPEDKSENVEVGDLQQVSLAEISFAKEKEQALLNRPDYQIIKKNLQQQDINLKFIENQKLPNLDLISDLGFQGLRGNFGSTLEDISHLDFYNYQIGLQLKYPLENKEAKEKQKIEKIKKEQLLLSLKNIEIKINNEIQNAIRDIVTASEVLKAQKKATELSYQNLQQEKEKFKLGLSTTFNVLQYEDDYNKIKTNELQAIINYNLAVSKLNKVTGKNILEYK